MNSNAVIFPRVFNLNSNSAVWVAANTLEQAIQHYLKEICGARGQADREEFIHAPREVKFDDWKDLPFRNDGGSCHTFEHQMFDRLGSGSEVPFILACEDY